MNNNAPEPGWTVVPVQPVERSPYFRTQLSFGRPCFTLVQRFRFQIHPGKQKEEKAMDVRKADFAGSWYPADSKACEREIQTFLKEGKHAALLGSEFVGGIVPHAGWYYSGSIACNVIHALSKGRAPEVIMVFGMHLHPDSDLYIMAAGAWETPFGEIEIHRELAEKLLERFDFQVETGRRHHPDNTIELQLPFIKYLFPDVKIIPIGAPPTATSLDVGRTAAEIASEMGVRIKVIGSTDLTHYGSSYGFTSHGDGPSAVDWVKNSNDSRIIETMLAMDPVNVIDEALANQNACCAGAAATAIAAVGRLGAQRAQTVVYATSYDKRPADSFVGYVGIVFD
jgi:AmmeMemoRadiSam system protein B